MPKIDYEKLSFEELLEIIDKTGNDDEVLWACAEITRRRQERFYQRGTA